jgi:hypothetical protein
MERTFFPNRGYWTALGALFAFLWIELIGVIVLSRQYQSPAQFDPVTVWGSISFLAVCILAFGVHGVLAFFRKRLVIGRDEVRCHDALSVRVLRFADVVEAQWSLANAGRVRRPYRLRLQTATAKRTIPLDQFLQAGAEDELVELLRGRLGPGVRQDWETFQALREGRASSWSPPVFTLRHMARLLAVATAISLVIGIGIGFGVWIEYPDIREWTWSGWPILDWCLYSGIVGLLAGILLLSVFHVMEWAQLKMRMSRS